MPTIRELLKSGGGTESTQDAKADREFLVQGISNDVDLRLYVESSAIGDDYIGLIAKSYTVEWVADYMAIIKVPLEQLSPQSKDKNKQPGDRKITFEIGGGTINAKTSLETLASYKDPAATAFVPPNFKNAINVDENGPQGTDIYVPSFSFEIAHWIAKTDLTPSYIVQLRNLCARYNNAAWQPTDGKITLPNFAAGEVLFLGCSGSERNEDDYELRYRFITEPNVSGRTLGNITGISKKGWDYLWARYMPKKDGVDQVKVPYYVYVERMYDPGDFSIL